MRESDELLLLHVWKSHCPTGNPDSTRTRETHFVSCPSRERSLYFLEEIRSWNRVQRASLDQTERENGSWRRTVRSSIYFVVTFEEIIARKTVETLDQIKRRKTTLHTFSSYFLEEIRTRDRIQRSFLNKREREKLTGNQGRRWRTFSSSPWILQRQRAAMTRATSCIDIVEVVEWKVTGS